MSTPHPLGVRPPEPGSLHEQNSGFLIPEFMRAELMSAWMSVHTELLADYAGRPMSPEELAEHRRARAETSAAMQAEHRLLLEDVPRGGLVEEILTLHAPSAEGYCDGCDFGGYEGESPGWPCRTYRATAVRYRRTFTEDHGTRMARTT